MDAGGGDSIYVNDSLVGATRRSLDSICERPTDLQHASQQSDGVLVSLDLYTDALLLSQITCFCSTKGSGVIFLNMNFAILVYIYSSVLDLGSVSTSFCPI